MTKIRQSLLATYVAAAITLGVTTLAHAQPPGNAGGRRQAGAAALGTLFNSLVNLQDPQVQASLQNTLNHLQGTQLGVLDLNQTLNGSQLNVLSEILNNSQALGGTVANVQHILSSSLTGNTVLQNFLSQNNIAIGRVVAIDLLSGQLNLITINLR